MMNSLYLKLLSDEQRIEIQLERWYNIQLLKRKYFATDATIFWKINVIFKFKWLTTAIDVSKQTVV